MREAGSAAWWLQRCARCAWFVARRPDASAHKRKNAIIGVREVVGGVVGFCCKALGLPGGSSLKIEVLTKISGVSFDESVRDHDMASTRLTVPRMP